MSTDEYAASYLAYTSKEYYEKFLPISFIGPTDKMKIMNKQSQGLFLLFFMKFGRD